MALAPTGVVERDLDQVREPDRKLYILCFVLQLGGFISNLLERNIKSLSSAMAATEIADPLLNNRSDI